MSISWSHISQMYYEDVDCAQVMSETVGKVLEAFGPPDAAETAKFILLKDNFFDYYNVRNAIEYKRPYTEIKMNDFIG